MKIIKGDLISLSLKGEFEVILHGSNCQNIMGSGIAAQIKKEYPEAYIIDQSTKKGDYDKLGTISFVKLPNRVIVVNCYTQYRYGRQDKQYVNYEALKQCLEKVKYYFRGLKIGMPLIGCGLGNGDEKIVMEIIEETLVNLDVTLVIKD